MLNAEKIRLPKDCIVSWNAELQGYRIVELDAVEAAFEPVNAANTGKYRMDQNPITTAARRLG